MYLFQLLKVETMKAVEVIILEKPSKSCALNCLPSNIKLLAYTNVSGITRHPYSIMMGVS